MKSNFAKKLDEQLRILARCDERRTSIREKIAEVGFSTSDVLYEMLRQIDQRELQAAKVVGRLCHSKKEPIETLIAIRSVLLSKTLDDYQKQHGREVPKDIKQLTSEWFERNRIPHTVVDAPIFLDGPSLWELEKKYDTKFPFDGNFEIVIPDGERLGNARKIELYTFKNESEALDFFCNNQPLFIYNGACQHWPENLNDVAVYVRACWGLNEISNKGA